MEARLAEQRKLPGDDAIGRRCDYWLANVRFAANDAH